jgi:dynein heavy chain
MCPTLQCQAVRWIKNMEAQAGLRVMSITASDMVRQLESAVQFGQPVLLVDVLEEIDPVLEPLLAKAYVK